MTAAPFLVSVLSLWRTDGSSQSVLLLPASLFHVCCVCLCAYLACFWPESVFRPKHCYHYLRIFIFLWRHWRLHTSQFTCSRQLWLIDNVNFIISANVDSANYEHFSHKVVSPQLHLLSHAEYAALDLLMNSHYEASFIRTQWSKPAFSWNHVTFL